MFSKKNSLTLVVMLAIVLSTIFPLFIIEEEVQAAEAIQPSEYEYDWTCQERPGFIACHPDNITEYEQKFEVTANQGSTWGPSSGMPDGEYYFWFWGVSGNRSFSVDRPNGTHQEARKVIPMSSARYPKRDTNEPAQSNPWIVKPEWNGNISLPVGTHVHTTRRKPECCKLPNTQFCRVRLGCFN